MPFRYSSNRRGHKNLERATNLLEICYGSYSLQMSDDALYW